MADETRPAPEPAWRRGPSLLSALWHYRWAVLVVALVSASAGYIYTAAQPPVFEAVGRVTLASPYDRTLFRNERGVPYVEIDRYLNTQANRMTSPDVLAEASELLEGRLNPRQIRQIVEAQSSSVVLEVTVRARSEDPSGAAETVNAVIQAYESVTSVQLQAQVEASVGQLAELEAQFRERLLTLEEQGSDPRVQAERASLSEELADLQTRAGQIRADAAVYGTGIERIEPAAVPEMPVSETPRRMAAVFGMLGLIAALVVAFWRSEAVRPIDNPDDVAGDIDAPLLGVTSARQTSTAVTAAAVVTAPDSTAAQEHQLIAAKLALLGREGEPRVVLVASPGQTPGKSVVALNLALSAAMDQRAVILADVDASGRLTGLLGADGRCGVVDLIARSADSDVHIGDCVSPLDGLPVVDGVRFIPTGPTAGEGGVVGSPPEMAKFLAGLLQEADLILLDGPPLLRAPAGFRLAADADAVVLVVGRGTAYEDLRETIDMLKLAEAPFVGYVFDRSRAPRRWRLPTSGLWPRILRGETR